MNTYDCTWKGLNVTVDAESSYKSQDAACEKIIAQYPKARVKPYQISTKLIARDGVAVADQPIFGVTQ